MRPEPWMYFNRTELANNARTTAYLRSLGPTGWTLPGCDCDTYNEGPYISPAADDAPWYVSTNAASQEFMGVLINNTEIAPVAGRATSPNGSFGSVVGGLRLRGRGITVTGVLTASSPRGMAYGKRWLSALLLDNDGTCATCGLSDLCILPYCPDGDADPNEAYRTFYRVGVIDGPIWSSQESIAECYITPFVVTFLSELPYMHSDNAQCVLDAQLTTATQRCCSVIVPDWPSNVAFKISITAGSPDPVTNLRIALTPDSDGVCETISDEAVLMLRATSYETADGTSWFNDVSNALTTFTATGSPRHLPASDHGQYAYYPGIGASANNTSAPDEDAYTPVTGTIVVEAMIEAADWTPASDQAIVSKWGAAGQRSWRLMLATTGHLRFEYSSDGTVVNTLTSYATLPTGDVDAPVWVRAMFTYDNLSYAQCHYYYKFAESDPWQYFGYAAGSVFTVFNSTATVNIGRSQTLDLLEFVGKIWWARIEVGSAPGSIDVNASFPLVSMFDARAMVEPFTTYVDINARTWTFGQTTADLPNVIVDRTCWLLDGTSDYFEAPDSALLDFAAADSLTIAAITRPVNASTARTLLAKRAAATGTSAGYNLSLDASGNVFLAIGDGAASTTDSQTGIVAGIMKTLAGVRNVTADNLRAYVDETSAAATTDTTTATLANANVIRVGRLTGAGTEYLHGQLFAIGAWRKALTTDELEIAAEYLLGEDPSGGAAACSEIIVRELPAGTRLEIDGARRVVEVFEESSGRVVGGLDVLELSPGVPFEWPVVGHCTTACMCVSAYAGEVNTDTVVAIESIVRDL